MDGGNSTMLTTIIIAIVIWVILSVFIEFALMDKITGVEQFPCSDPDDFYENTKMNRFGCWFCFILIRILVPLNTLALLIVAIVYYPCIFIKWLFTVGRKDE